MITIVFLGFIFIGLIVGLNCIPLLTKKNFPKTEKVIVKIFIASTILFLTYTIFDFNSYRLKGLYTFTVICFTFIISTVIFYSIVKNTEIKILTVFLTIPLIIYIIFYGVLFGRVLNQFNINDSLKITVTSGGLLSCGETIKITQSKFGIFDKEVYKDEPCLLGIEKIETLIIDDTHAEFLIYHDKKLDSENPYKYIVERKNLW